METCQSQVVIFPWLSTRLLQSLYSPPVVPVLQNHRFRVGVVVHSFNDEIQKYTINLVLEFSGLLIVSN